MRGLVHQCLLIPPHLGENIVPFHKLTQWLTYSLMVPMQKLANIEFAGVELMTGLPEYRNGGLLVDTGLLTLKPWDFERGVQQYYDNATRQGQPNVEVVPLFTADDDVIVEWRALTVGFLDMLLQRGEHNTRAKRQYESQPSTNARSRYMERRPRDCRGLAAKHEGATHHDLVRRHGFLGEFTAQRLDPRTSRLEQRVLRQRQRICLRSAISRRR